MPLPTDFAHDNIVSMGPEILLSVQGSE
jgi:hypothetical protein